MKKVVVTGGTGFIGQSLADHLSEKGFQPIIIARNPPNKPIKYPFVAWDGVTVGEWASQLSGALAVVNLAGKTVDCIKTPDNCDLILRSRVDTTKAIGKALNTVENPPKIWIQMSTAHIYGDPPSQMCTESSSFGYGLAPFVGKEWEVALLEALPEGTREVRLRTSFVIGKNGGALSTLKQITRLGLGGKVGHGNQGISWIHEYDLNEFIHQAIKNDTFSGAYLTTAPNPVSQAEFMRTLRKQMRIPIGLPAPEWATRFGARFLFRTDPELVLYGRYVKSERIPNSEFSFRFPHLKEALQDLV
ncbi:MAG: TIGR01777 family oxidoreductase [Bacteroidota bacterium]